jgi:hypothetical protein
MSFRLVGEMIGGELYNTRLNGWCPGGGHLSEGLNYIINLIYLLQ